MSTLISKIQKIAVRGRKQNWNFEFSVKNLVKMKEILRYVT